MGGGGDGGGGAPRAELEARLAEVKTLALKDATAGRREFFVTPPAALCGGLRGLLVDDRDTPLLYLLMNVCVFVLPAAVALFCLPASHALGGVYLAATIALFFQRFILALHYSEHRGLSATPPWGEH